MAKKLHYCRNTVASHIRLLEERGLIKAELAVAQQKAKEKAEKLGIGFIPASDGQSA